MRSGTPVPTYNSRGGAAGGLASQGGATLTDERILRGGTAGSIQDSSVSLSDTTGVFTNTTANTGFTFTPNGTGRVAIADGSAAAPPLGFVGQGAGVGWYPATSAITRWTPDGGTSYFDLRSTGVFLNSGAGLRNDVASATTPVLLPAFVDDSDTGIGRAGANQLSLIAGAVEGLRVEAAKATFAGRILAAKGADVASANDITLGDGNYFDITGTTQINTIAGAGWTPGTPVILQFDASVTVKHNTAGTGVVLLLAGAADFAATAGDTLTLVYETTAWRELARTVV